MRSLELKGEPLFIPITGVPINFFCKLPPVLYQVALFKKRGCKVKFKYESLLVDSSKGS